MTTSYERRGPFLDRRSGRWYYQRQLSLTIGNFFLWVGTPASRRPRMVDMHGSVLTALFGIFIWVGRHDCGDPACLPCRHYRAIGIGR